MTLCGLSACGSGGSSLSARVRAGTEAYVANFADPAQPGTAVSRVDTVAGTVDPPLRTTVTEPAAVAAVPGTDHLVVVGTGDDQLVVLDGLTGAVLRRVVVGLEPDAVAVTPDGREALVADSGSGQLTVVDLRTGRVVRTLKVGADPDAVAVSGRAASGWRAVVLDGTVGAAIPLRLPGPTVGYPVAVGAEPDAVAITAGGTALVADLGSDQLVPVDLASGHVGAPVALGVPPTAVAVTTAPAPGTSPATDPTGTAWVAGGGDLVPVNLATMTAGHPVPVGHPAEALALTDGGRRAWVADQNAAVTEVDLATGRPLRTVAVGGRPSAIAIPGPS